MSGRLFKKVLKEQEQQQLQLSAAEPQFKLLNHDDDDVVVVDSDSDAPPPPSRNPFELLEDDDQDDELDVVGDSSPPDVEDQKPSLVGTLPLSNRKSKKKKKKTKEDHNSTNKDKSQKSIDGFLESLAIDAKLSSHQPTTTKSKAKDPGVSNNLVKKHSPSILSVQPKFLRPENELRRIFGSDVVRSFENSNTSGSSRQLRGGRRAGHNPRKTFLVSPSDHWPRWDGSLSMELVETKDGQHFFKYVHTSSYSHTQRAFEAAKAINDLNGIASILVYQPYHIESLITIAEVLKFSGEHQAAADAISKCLFALECAWHPMFNPLQGDCQLKFNHETNRPLFSVLFTHMLNMDRRGCHRSALEVCKLLLSLDSDDPMGAMFCIDYFSLRAEEYSWLERFSEEYRSDNSLWLFPNFSYSLAIARLYLERDSCTESTSKKNEMAASSDLMKQALMLHPSVLKKLVEKAPLKDPAWTKILKHKFFGSAQTGGPSVEHLIDIYVERNYIIWRLPDLQVLLRDAAQLVIETLDHNGSDAMDWACVRKEAFPSEKNEYSHLLVSDFSGSVPQMPPDDLRDLMVDPHMAHAMGNGGHEANPEAHARVPLEVMNRNPMIVFLESLLPWADYGGPLDDNHFDGHNRDED